MSGKKGPPVILDSLFPRALMSHRRLESSGITLNRHPQQTPRTTGIINNQLISHRPSHPCRRSKIPSNPPALYAATHMSLDSIQAAIRSPLSPWCQRRRRCAQNMNDSDRAEHRTAGANVRPDRGSQSHRGRLLKIRQLPPPCAMMISHYRKATRGMSPVSQDRPR